MKGFLTFLAIIIIIPLLIVGGALAFIYFSFFNPQPAEYVYVNPADQITSIEIAEISFANGEPTPTGIGVITDKEAFLADFEELECNKGIDLNSLSYISGSQSIEGIVIHYADGSTEIITAYVSLGLKQSESVGLSSSLYSFDPEEFGEMLDEYKDLYVNPEDLENLPNLDGVEIPEDIEIPEDLGN